MTPDIKFLMCCFSVEYFHITYFFLMNVHTFAENFSDKPVGMCCVKAITPTTPVFFMVIMGNLVALIPHGSDDGSFLPIITVRLAKCCSQLTLA